MTFAAKISPGSCVLLIFIITELSRLTRMELLIMKRSQMLKYTQCVWTKPQGHSCGMWSFFFLHSLSFSVQLWMVGLVRVGSFCQTFLVLQRAAFPVQYQHVPFPIHLLNILNTYHPDGKSCGPFFFSSLNGFRSVDCTFWIIRHAGIKQILTEP